MQNFLYRHMMGLWTKWCKNIILPFIQSRCFRILTDNKSQHIKIAFYVQSSFPSILCTLPYLTIISTEPSRHYFYTHFRNGNSKAQRRWVTCPISTQQVIEPELKTRQPGSVSKPSTAMHISFYSWVNIPFGGCYGLGYFQYGLLYGKLYRVQHFDIDRITIVWFWQILKKKKNLVFAI